MEMAEFDAWVHHYDTVHKGLEGEEAFYLEETKKCSGKILELGCGTGRITIPIALQGKSVVGLDISQPMLDECARKWGNESHTNHKNLTLIQGDMSDFDLGEQFPLIIMPYRSFMHLLTQKQQINCLNRIADHLEPGGLFIMNTWVPSAAYIYAFGSSTDESEFNQIDTYEQDTDGGVIEHYHNVQYHEFSQHMYEEHLLITKNSKNESIKKEILPLVRTWFTVREMKNLIIASELMIESVWGSFDRTPIDETHTEAIWVLKGIGS